MSGTALIPQMLDAGLAAIQLAGGDGVRLRITHIALGDAGYTPHPGQLGLRHEIVRYPIADGKSTGPRQLHLTALADDSAEFWVREVAFILETGQALAVWSHPSQALVYKQAGLELLLAYDLTLAGVPPDSVIVQSTGAGLNLSLAEELASLAGAVVVGMQTDLQHDSVLAELGRGLSTLRTDLVQLDERATRGAIEHAGQWAALSEADRQTTQSLDQLARQQASDYGQLLEIQAANAAAIIDLQNNAVKGVMA
ncbi:MULTISPECIES: phage tail protein [Chromobacterium]|uniref:phage tail protein n=1 Tax=Chromobacterium TaxID=535 RepID=UPI00188750C7|nr:MULTISPECIES: phage tail protein [Chromobacterium]QOZ83190.1 phage tail protein [Chromobacterium sp. Rain0013]WON83290.1 phage tail protein [Chromobacterium haemolyticum]